jgi:choice-of-anchor C domain-containing protein
MHRGLKLVGAIIFFWMAGPAWGALLTNPSFEQPVVPNPDFQYYFAGDPAITGWTIVGSSVDLLSTHFKAQDGNQSLDLNGLDPGGVYQNVPTQPGQSYHLSFWIAGNADPAGIGPAVKQMKLNWGGAPVATLSFDITGKTKTNPGWTQYSYDLTATSALTRLEFDGTSSGTAGVLLDNVSLAVNPAAVPLPPALGIGIVGAGAVEVLRRRWK